MFRFPDSLSADEFLRRYWQKSPLFMPGALDAGLPALSPDELAWLATLDDVESRLVFADRTKNKAVYRVEHGPFDDARLRALPAQDWTLLVQDVEKHLPAFRVYFHEASFVPDWRIDDLMVSFAAAGGTVGPHRDSYDVFLCQGFGRREWRIAPADSELRPVEENGLALLEPFTCDEPVTAAERDVLYLPPGVAHWGIATEACMTYSIGMRTPSLHGDSGYTDPDLRADEAEPGLISKPALARARRSLRAGALPDEKELARAFGCRVTDLKDWLRPDSPGRPEAEALVRSGASGYPVHGMARLAFCRTDRTHLVFVNGACKPVSATAFRAFQRLCATRTADEDLLGAAGRDLLSWLARQGAFDLQSVHTDHEG